MNYYTLNNQCHIFTPTEYTLLSNIDDIEREGMNRSIPSWNPHELATEFKEAAPTIKRLIKEKKSELILLQEKEVDIKNWCYKNCLSRMISREIVYATDDGWEKEIITKSEREWQEFFYTNIHVIIPRVKLENQIKKLEQILFYMQKGRGGELDVEKARQRPISDFIEFNNAGFARSIWNTADKTPSMKLYRKENRVHCFSTGEDEDVIGVVMTLKNCSFIEAVKFILN